MVGFLVVQLVFAFHGVEFVVVSNLLKEEVTDVERLEMEIDGLVSLASRCRSRLNSSDFGDASNEFDDAFFHAFSAESNLASMSALGLTILGFVFT